MSLFRIRRKKRLVVALSPGAMAVAHQDVSGNEPTTHLDKLGPGEVGKPAWDAPLKALEKWIETQGEGKLLLRIVLSNHFVRYTIVPWSENSHDIYDRRLTARCDIQRQHGPLPGWEICLDKEEHGKPQLVHAIPKGLIIGLRQLMDRVDASCVSVDPFFLLCWKRWGQSGTYRNSVVVIAEQEGPAILATVKNGLWESIRVVSGFHTVESLANIAAREAILKQQERRVGWLFLAGDSTDRAVNPCRLDVKQIAHRAGHSALDMALVPIA